MDVDHEDHRRRLGTVKNQFIADLNQHAGFLPICVEAFAPGESSISCTFLGGQRLSVQAAQSIESTLTGGVCPIQPDQPFFCTVNSGAHEPYRRKDFWQRGKLRAIAIQSPVGFVTPNGLYQFALEALKNN
jgi:hypothetical protein